MVSANPFLLPEATMPLIALEISNLEPTKPTGISRYMLELIQEYTQLYASHELCLLHKLSRWKHRKQMRDLPYRLQAYDERFWTWFKQPDIIHGLDSLAPKISSARRVVTIHDVFILQDCPDPVCSPEFRERKRSQFQQIAEDCDAIITVSETSRHDLLQQLPISENKVFATPLGVHTRFAPRTTEEIAALRQRFGLAEEYLLFVGDLSVRKNTTRLVQAFAQSGLDLQLVLAGRRSYRGEETLEAIRKSGIESQILWLDFVHDKDLPTLYSGALGFAFPTLYEGFGIPILEAMACGTPVLVGDQGAGPEVVGTLGLQCHPYDVDSITEGLRQLAQTQKTLALREHAQRFTWRECARRTSLIYQEAPETPPASPNQPLST